MLKSKQNTCYDLNIIQGGELIYYIYDIIYIYTYIYIVRVLADFSKSTNGKPPYKYIHIYTGGFSITHFLIGGGTNLRFCPAKF